MRFERCARNSSTPALGAMVGGVLLLGAVTATVWLRLGLPRPVCSLREWTGLPCATCGSTRMVEALLSGDVVGAVAWNPLVFSVLTAIAIWSAGSAAGAALGLPAWRVVLVRRERLGFALLAAAALLGGWGYLLWRG